MKKIYRSINDRFLGGVCGGIAEFFQIDSALVRIAFVLAVFFKGIGVLIYIVALIIIPNNTNEKTGEKNKFQLSNISDSYFWGLAAIILGVILLLRETPLFDFIDFYYINWTLFIALIFILIGAYLLYLHIKEKTDDDNLDAPDVDDKIFKTKLKFYKKSNEKMIGGVCAGIAHYFNLDVSLTRIIFVVAAIFTKGIIAALYFLMMILLPEYEEDKLDDSFKDDLKED